MGKNKRQREKARKEREGVASAASAASAFVESEPSGPPVVDPIPLSISNTSSSSKPAAIQAGRNENPEAESVDDLWARSEDSDTPAGKVMKLSRGARRYNRRHLLNHEHHQINDLTFLLESMSVELAAARAAPPPAAQSILHSKLAFFASLHGIDPDNFNIISVSKCPARMKLIRAIEAKHALANHPKGYLSLSDAQEVGIQLVRSGFNVLQDQDSGEYVGIINFRDLNTLSPHERADALQCMENLDLITRTTRNVAKDNGSTGHGAMFAYGWKVPYTRPDTFDKYVPGKNKGQSAQFQELETGKATQVMDHLLSRFKALYTPAFDSVHQYALAHNIPRCDTPALVDLNMGLNGEIMAGPNSLTVTRDGFSNVHHVDRDASSWAFGIFWSGTTKEGKFTGEVCQVDEVLQGGEFWWAEYGVAVASAPDGQYAELAWRAMRDYHGTLACSLVDGGVWRDAKANRKVDDLGCRAPRRTRFRQRFRMGLGILKPGHGRCCTSCRTTHRGNTTSWPFPRSALWSDWGDSTREPEVDKLERVEAVWLAPVHLSPDNNHLALRWHWDIGPSSGGRDNDLEAEHVVLAVLFIPDITKA